MKQPIFVQALSACSALGDDLESLRSRLWAAQDPDSLTWTDQYSPGRQLPLGCLPAHIQLPDLGFAPMQQRSRNNALAWHVVQPLRGQINQALAQWGAHRVALIVGTSTAGVQEGERAAAYWRTEQQFPADFDYAVQETIAAANQMAAAIAARVPLRDVGL